MNTMRSSYSEEDRAYRRDQRIGIAFAITMAVLFLVGTHYLAFSMGAAQGMEKADEPRPEMSCRQAMRICRDNLRKG